MELYITRVGDDIFIDKTEESAILTFQGQAYRASTKTITFNIIELEDDSTIFDSLTRLKDEINALRDAYYTNTNEVARNALFNAYIDAEKKLSQRVDELISMHIERI